MAVWTVTSTRASVSSGVLLLAVSCLGISGGRLTELLIRLKAVLDPRAKVAFRHLDIILGVTVSRHEAEEAIVRDVNLDNSVSIAIGQCVDTEIHLPAGIRCD